MDGSNCSNNDPLRCELSLEEEREDGEEERRRVEEEGEKMGVVRCGEE